MTNIAVTSLVDDVGASTNVIEGRLDVLPNDASLAQAESKSHSHASLRQFLALRHGTGQIEADGARWTIGENAVVLLPPGTVHSMVFSPDAQAYLLTASEAMMVQRVAPALAHLEPNYRHRLDAPLTFTMSPPATSPRLTERAFHTIDLARHWLGHGSDPVVVGFMLTVLFGSQFQGPGEAAVSPHADGMGMFDSDADLLVRFRTQIDLHYREHLNIDQFCASIGVSQARLNHACRNVLGRSPLEVIHERLMRDATRELLYTAKTASEIAYGLGFADPAYFCRFFKRRAGVSPGRYRSRSAA